MDLMEVSQGELPVITAQRDLMEVGQVGITCYNSTKRSDGSKSRGITC